jgi:carbamoyltransferase
MGVSDGPIMQSHPQFGYLYVPHLRKRLTQAGVGYLMRTNGSGFRSEHEFEERRRPGTRRVLMFGDSQAAGDCISNSKRFSDLIEKKLDAAEVYNLSLTGSGTDQQFLIHREFAPKLPHDLTVICVFVENILRVQRKLFVRPNPEGQVQFYGKPYFELKNGKLLLKGLPVPDRPWSAETLPPEIRGDAQEDFKPPTVRKRGRIEKLARRLLPSRALQMIVPLLRRFIRHGVLPAYNSPNTPEWQLLRAMLRAWIEESPTPVLLVPLPLSYFITHPGDARACQARFAELARETGCGLYDPLPDLCRLDMRNRREIWDHRTLHLSEYGHQVLADLLTPVIESILPEPEKAVEAQHLSQAEPS